ncbi:hypothetical protein, partial [Lysobacter enzymogenes]|uniref:hypothetical protein n=1 Tax=Lysobacter enzymogenes TaxID=69 RepID=UPI0019D09DFD
LLAALERIAAAQAEPDAAPPADAGAALSAALTGLGPQLQQAFVPLVERLQDNDERQSRVNAAMVELFQRLGEREVHDAPTRAEMTEQQRELQRALNEFADRLNGRTQR